MIEEPKFRLGENLVDQITGFSGMVVSLSEWQSNCHRYTLKPRKLKEDGSPFDAQVFDVTHLRAGQLDGGVDLRRDYPKSRSEAKIGDTVSDRNTDLTGTVVAMHYDINGCVGYYIQARALTKDHKPAEMHLIWDLDVRIVTPVKKQAQAVTSGGVRKDPSRRREPKAR